MCLEYSTLCTANKKLFTDNQQEDNGLLKRQEHR